MKINLTDMTVNSLKILNRLSAYLDSMIEHEWFKRDQLVQVYVNSEKDFTAFESVEYAFGFTSADHKLIETISSKYILDPVSFNDFRRYIQSLQQTSS